MGIGLVGSPPQNQGREKGGNAIGDRGFGKALVALIFGTDVVSAEATRSREGLVVAAQDTGSGEVEDALTSLWVKQGQKGKGFVHIGGGGGFGVAPGGGGEDGKINGVEQVSVLLDVFEVALEHGDAGTGLGVELEFGGGADEEVEVMISGLDEAIGQVVAYTTTGPGDKNAFAVQLSTLPLFKASNLVLDSGPSC